MRNIHLLFHGFYNQSQKSENELFVSIEETKELFDSLTSKGYKYKLAKDISPDDSGICSVSFDDGYKSCMEFIPVAEKHSIPFLFFVTSKPIVEESAFAWDLFSSSRSGEAWNFAREDYSKIYRDCDSEKTKVRTHPLLLPMTALELRAMNQHPLCFLAPHGHTHQPFIGISQQSMEDEINACTDFLKKFPKVLTEDFSLPCGLYNLKTISFLKKRFKRIYTIEGRGWNARSALIHRISLMNSTSTGQDLVSQINRFQRTIPRIRRIWTTLRHSYLP